MSFIRFEIRIMILISNLNKRLSDLGSFNPLLQGRQCSAIKQNITVTLNSQEKNKTLFNGQHIRMIGAINSSERQLIENFCKKGRGTVCTIITIVIIFSRFPKITFSCCNKSQ